MQPRDEVVRIDIVDMPAGAVKDRGDHEGVFSEEYDL